MHELNGMDQGAHGRTVDLDARWGSKSTESIFVDHSGQSDFPIKGERCTYSLGTCDEVNVITLLFSVSKPMHQAASHRT